MENTRSAIPWGWMRALMGLILLMLIGMAISKIGHLTLQAAGLLPTKPNWETNSIRGLLFTAFVSITTALSTAWLACLLIDKKPFSSLGTIWQSQHAGIGFFVGIILLLLPSLFFLFNGNLQVNGYLIDQKQLWVGIVIMLLIAWGEELIFRGYILGNLLQSMNKWLALLISALVFAGMHWRNPNVDTIALINIFLAGILLGLNYIYTRNLWFGWLLHFTWNFFQGAVLGYPVSGLKLVPVLQSSINGDDWLTGGKFGLEGSVISTVTHVLMIGVLWLLFQKKQDQANRLAATENNKIV
jgi:uncharacterized protein